MAIAFSDISFLKGDFDSEVTEFKEYSERKTGFDNIDDVQVFAPGLYVLGGATGAGKTTFALQLLCQLAARGSQCIFFSFEMSAFTLWAKVLARELFERHFKADPLNAPKKSLSAARLMQGRGVGNKEICDLKHELASSSLPLRIAEVNQRGKDFLKELPKEEGTVICFDYLQMLAHNTENPRGAIDETIFSFREYQRKTKSTLIILNSVNRESYKQEASLSSYKESGGIEYTADFAWVLQAFAIDDNLKFDSEASLEESRKIERRVRLSCLKNRFGGQYKCDFTYYAAHDCFHADYMLLEDRERENREEENPSGKPKAKRKRYVK